MKLTETRPDQNGVIRKIGGDAHFMNRITAIGVTEGTAFQTVRNDGSTMKNRIALLGQSNSGKSTVFNALTGSRQHVGNWPGKTVEKIDGYYTYKGTRFTVTDLPGIRMRKSSQRNS